MTRYDKDFLKYYIELFFKMALKQVYGSFKGKIQIVSVSLSGLRIL